MTPKDSSCFELNPFAIKTIIGIIGETWVRFVTRIGVQISMLIPDFGDYSVAM